MYMTEVPAGSGVLNDKVFLKPEFYGSLQVSKERSKNSILP